MKATSGSVKLVVNSIINNTLYLTHKEINTTLSLIDYSILITKLKESLYFNKQFILIFSL